MTIDKLSEDNVSVAPLWPWGPRPRPCGLQASEAGSGKVEGQGSRGLEYLAVGGGQGYLSTDTLPRVFRKTLCWKETA